MKMHSHRWFSLLILVGIMLGSTGCRYMTNRYYDFRDTWAMGIGASSENSVSGMLPPALGVYVEATDFLHLGAITHYGPIAEVDLRGSGVYYEERMRLGLGPWQALHLGQDYEGAAYRNYFKTPNTKWERNMKSIMSSWRGTPAKDLTYMHWAVPCEMQYGTLLLHRGYQYWEYMGVEAAICDPFLTHLGIYAKAGVDVSELSDFLLGWFCIDYKGDDLSERMYQEMMDLRYGRTPAPCPAPAAPAVAAVPMDQTELERLRAENQRLARELAECQAKMQELADGGIEIQLPEKVFFDTGKATLRPEGKQKLENIVSHIKAQYPGYKVTIEGHTDSRPVVVHKHLFKSNWELGSARANTVVHFLEDRGVQVYKSESYSANEPVATNATPAGRQDNRRAVIVLRAQK